MKIEVLEAKETTRKRRDGQGTFRVQQVFVHNGGAYPEAIDLPLGKDGSVYQPGMYTLSSESFRVFARRLEFWPKLVPQRDTGKTAAA